MTASLTRVLRCWPFLVPPLYLALILSVQPRDRLGDPGPEVLVGRLLYDDYDMTAFALRGLNALGHRPPGAEYPPQIRGAEFRFALDAPFPLQPRYFLEYPPAVLPVFALGWLVQLDRQQDAPPAVLDAWYNNIVEHWPRDERESQLWRQFRRAIQVYLIVMTLALLGLMTVLKIGYEPDGALAGPIFLLVLPGVLYYSLNRFDILPALLTALSLACLGRRRLTASAVFLALATALKVYPVLLAPLFFRFLSHERRRCLTWTAIYLGTLAVCLAPPLFAWDWEAVLAPYRFQLARPAERGWTVYGVLLPWSWSENNVAGRLLRLGSVVLVGLMLFVRRPVNLDGLLRRAAVVLLVFVALQVFYSPQWIVWLSPLLVPLARLQPTVLGLTIALDLVTYASFPVVYDAGDLPHREEVRAGLIVARVALLVALAVVLLIAERRSLVTAPSALASA